MDAGEIRIRTFSDYYVTSDRIVNAFSKTRPVDDLDASDFERLRASMAETLGPVYLGTEIQRVRSVFKYGYDSGLIDRPVRFGPTFKPPSRKVMRQNRTVKGPRMLEAEQIRRLLDTATPQLRAMILLGVNCGFGNTDVATLPVDAVDLDDGWIDYPRPKTGVPRRCPLWQGTVQAIHEAIEVKPKPRNTADADLVFLTFLGRPWVRPGKGRSWIDSLGLQFGKLLRRLEIYRPGLNFYALRHTFETIAGDSKDQIAVDAIMGHDRGDMASVYRERISDDRLVAVAEHVRAWLFSPGA
ncbi:MAG: tyrosine-type recombinase/integrase [Planctomycetota bacterium]